LRGAYNSLKSRFILGLLFFYKVYFQKNGVLLLFC
jgi:hypothetical protein